MTDEERREHIKQRWGVDLHDPFMMTVFLDETVQWQPVTIVFAWLAALYAEECGDNDPGEAYRIAQARVPLLTHDDWWMFMMAVRRWGALLSREIPKESE